MNAFPAPITSGQDCSSPSRSLVLSLRTTISLFRPRPSEGSHVAFFLTPGRQAVQPGKVLSRLMRGGQTDLPVEHVVFPHEIAIRRDLEAPFFPFRFHHDFVVPPAVAIVFPRQPGDLAARRLFRNRLLYGAPRQSDQDRCFE